jgi:hypothetical protein
MSTIRERLFHWRHQGQEVAITAVLDDADFDLVNGQTYRRVVNFQIDGNLMRGGAFRATWPGRPAVAAEIPDTLLRTITPPTRITEQDLGWDFTPTHVDVRPGSVSNPSLLTSGGGETDAGSHTTAAFTPTADALLVVGWTGSASLAAGQATFTYTNTHAGSGSWAAVEATEATNVAARHSQARCQMGGSPGSGTITNTYSVNRTRAAWIIAEATGHHTTTPLSESNTGAAATGTSLSVALASVAAGNLAIGTVYVRGASAITVGANETELAEAVSGTTATVARTQMEYGTDTTVNWTWAGSGVNIGVAIEYAQAAGGAVTRSQAVIIG